MTDRSDGASNAGDEIDLAQQIDEAVSATTQAEALGQNAFDRILNGLVAIAGAGILVAITSLIFVNAALRYTVNAPLVWADEIVINLVPWLAMCGVFLSIRHREVIAVTYIADMLPDRLRRVIKAIADVLAAVSFAYLAYISINYLSMFGGDRTIYLRIPARWFISAMVIGSVLVAFAFLAESVRRWREMAAEPSTGR